MKNKVKMIMKSFRMKENVEEAIKILKKIDPNITMQKVITDALDEYLQKNLIDAEEKIIENQKLEDEIRIKEYMYIPVKYYAFFNELSRIEMDRMLKWNEVKSINIGNTTLIMIDVNESIYKKAELLTIKGNVSTVIQEVSSLKREVNSLKRAVAKFAGS